MRIKESQDGDVTVLTLSGKMMNESIDLHPYVKDLIEQDKMKVVVDMGKVKWFSSTGLGAMLASATSLRNAGGDIKIARATRKIESVFYMMELTSVFESFESVEEAVESFQ
ncbi:MAG: STAS domain-containing protein [Candidatus Marinimicrobia bacterium]|nr:STAS domain-containing protein [Candidatus Neomarinimicrobiota bacterium]MCF7830321.1 STAS domain-containing protein [Candidatus Neomarinimicrobiota bacterium]MCF7882298.1 STAS domain-containing protein [Candidatus Neomarinimicrobiota bacterium]